MSKKTAVHGYPIMGPNRELKFLIEKYWKGEVSQDALIQGANEINNNRINQQKNSGADFIGSGTFLYDQILTQSLIFGVIPERFEHLSNDIDQYFAMARGIEDSVACEMTKWFDTNYHYYVPELSQKPFKLNHNIPLNEYNRIKEETGVKTTPTLIGPFTYISLSKVSDNQTDALANDIVKVSESPEFENWVLSLCRVYNQLLKTLENAGVTRVQLDEPSLVLDQSDQAINTLIKGYEILTEGLTSLDVNVQTYYESVSQYQRVVNDLPVQGIGLDFCVNSENLNAIQTHGFPKDKVLLAGVVSGRDLWKSNLKEIGTLLSNLETHVSADQIIITNAAPLYHLPHTIEDERSVLDPTLLEALAFANERLIELETIKTTLNNNGTLPDINTESVQEKFRVENVQNEINSLNESSIGRSESFQTRQTEQASDLNLPLFPTTTIGSFPQSQDLRQKRKAFRTGALSVADYESYINTSMDDLVQLQEEIGLDVFVHGEFERTDMVEFFGEKLSGFAFTTNGWVQSYGSRCVKPPIIYGDVSRPNAMTVKETCYAQSKTKKPMKGMLTGPVTILNWSFYRKDISKKEIAYQIGLALREEVLDLEAANITIIQIDEPAFREGLPLKKAKQDAYLNWAVNAFKLSHDTVKSSTQIHTHMCYSEFNEIIESIRAMDADVISIEASRSRGEILDVFKAFNYDKGIGLGVYDIHSPRVPSTEEMLDIANRSIQVIDKKLIWINPDCGLKTRKDKETIASLKNMVEAAKQLRKKVLQSV